MGAKKNIFATGVYIQKMLRIISRNFNKPPKFSNISKQKPTKAVPIIEKSNSINLVNFTGLDNKNVGIPYLEKEMFTVGNLVRSIDYNKKEENYKVKITFKYEAYGYLNANAIETQTFNLKKDEIKYHAMLEDIIGNYPAKQMTFLSLKQFHKISKSLKKFIKYWKPEENEKKEYCDESLDHVIVIKIPEYCPKSLYPGYCVIPQKYSRI